MKTISDAANPRYRWLAALRVEHDLRERTNWQRVNGPMPSIEEMENWEPKPGINPSREQLQEWWRAVEGVWREYSRQIATGLLPDPPPADLALVMAGLCGYLAVGKLPEPVRDAVSEGRTPPGPDERRDIGLAVSYHKAARGGIIHNGILIRVTDETPTKTISNSFNVKKGTVRGWVQKYDPAFLGINDINSDTLVHLMNEAGKRYGGWGRSQAAITEREGKRR